ncbi:MAG: DUF2817 domain-containing protein [Polyangiales bacterium]|nr:DUF2817 domain-containing protein [Myxococcales bacterium]MCB9657173.1 DUF2817 domain-containing protein [Sandaracinaceae bacterium]
MSFPELRQLLDVVDALSPWARTTVRGHVDVDGQRVPLLDVCVGATDPSAPTLALVGGVHGLERIGAQVVLAELESLAARLAWDSTLRRELELVRVAAFPIVNPWGMAHGTRSNAGGVDLMRNAPPVAPGQRATPLLGGQSLSRHLPWYAGPRGDAGMELEARALSAFVREHVFPAACAVAVDAHSGFGLRDRLWFPYAYTRAPFPGLAETAALAALLDRSLPHHVYRIEPQAQAYTIRGDLWDHLYDLHRAQRRAGQGPFIPLTLEMGSWTWVRKNPRQLVTHRDGGFHPVAPHRIERTLRRHLPLIEFLRRAVSSADAWVPGDALAHERAFSAGYHRWYA